MFINWPTMQEAEQSMENIEQLYGFPGVIGAVDGTHIKISAPKDNSESYINRKGFHSIQLQVIFYAIYILINMILETLELRKDYKFIYSLLFG